MTGILQGDSDRSGLPQVTIGTFRLPGCGQIRTYLPGRIDRPQEPDFDSGRVTFSMVHPAIANGVAAVSGLETDAPIWDLSPADWTERQRAEAIKQAVRLKQAAQSRAGH